MRIHRLPSDLVNQIAAGEVVERPASVVKELVENALDAGATAIDVRVEAGGKKIIEVSDDGCGMSADDAMLAVERHATSKIGSFDDLTSVRTLGFRGEALPSIASVSRFTLLTSDGTAPDATAIVFDPMSGHRDVRPAARDRGTTIAVRELFENVPARRKFLRSADAEFRSIAAVVSSYALPHHSRAFRLAHNGRVVLDLPAASSVRERVVQVLGSEADAALEPIEGVREAVKAFGYVTRGLRWGSRRNQFFFVNGRLVKDRVLTHASNRAAGQFDFDGHPGVVLFLEVSPEMVDVNVHPAKTEVRFRDSGLVHVVVESAIRRALGGPEEGSGLLQPAAEERFAAVPQWSAAGSAATALFPPRIYDAPNGPGTAYEPLFTSQAATVQPPVSQRDREDLAPHDLGGLRGRVIGQYRLSYILLDVPGGLRLVDQHVAHERVLYDRYWLRLENGSSPSQQLITPLLYECGAAEAAVLESHLGELQSVGFDIERFSGNSFAVAAVPHDLVAGDTAAFLRKLIDASLDEKPSHVTKVREKICASLACQAAIKVHRPLGGEEMARLVSELLESSNPYACPHGRPIIVDIRHIDVERHFHRR